MNEFILQFGISFRQRRIIIITSILFFLLFFTEYILLQQYIFNHPQSIFIFLLGDILIVGLVGWVLAEPLAIYAYLRDVRREQKPKYKLYTPLNAIRNIDETPIDATLLQQGLDISKLVWELKTHVLILGLPGAGKTMALHACQYPILEHPWRFMWGRNRIPIYVPLKDYNVFLGKTFLPTQGPQNQPLQPYPASILAYLRGGSNLTGLEHLKPYLESLAQHGRILFLCDGLNEIDTQLLEGTCTELLHTMQLQQNQLVMTCRELDYRELSTLRQLVGKDHAEMALILPLKMAQIADFVEKYVQFDYQITRRQHYTSYEINELIKGSRLSYNCTNPMMLITLIQTIDEVGIDRDIIIGTKGRLLNKFVSHLIHKEKELNQSKGFSFSEQDIVLFLGKVAFIARLNGLRNGIQLGRTQITTENNAPKNMPLAELAERLQFWLVQHTPAESFIESQSSQLLPAQLQYGREEVEQFLKFAQSAALITISHNGVLSFSHELIAEYFAASYLYWMDTQPVQTIPFGSILVADIGSWSEPVAIWAGMSDNPIELARRLANLGQGNRDIAYNALSLSLTCAGVVWTPPHTHSEHKVDLTLPENVTQLLVSFMPYPERRSKLAETIRRSADQGGVEVYRSLLPLLMETGIDDLLILLDQRTVPELLFDYLRDALDTAMPANQIDRLVHILGRFGNVVIPHAVELSKADTHNRLDLRVEAIHILGQTNSIQAVKPLLGHLGDPEHLIRKAAVKAILNLGPGFTLESSLDELKNQTPNQALGKVHWSILAVLEGFLTKQLNAYQYQHIIETLLLALSSKYMQSVQDKTKQLLQQQASSTTNAYENRWQRVIEWLIRSLADSDNTKTLHIAALLKQLGTVATPFLLTELNSNKMELARARIVEIVGTVCDPAAIQPLLPFLADPYPSVQQQVAIALRNFAPESIPSLINLVLNYQVDDVAKKATSVLKEIGSSCVMPIIQKLEPIKPGRTQLLIEVLVHVKASQTIRPLINLLKKLPDEQALATTVIEALSQFSNREVVPPLIEVLIQWNAPLYTVASRALSSLGELACDALIAALDVPEETPTTARVRNTLLNMHPFLKERLLTTFKTCSNALAQQLEHVFLKKDDTAPFLVEYISTEDQHIRKHVFNILQQMEREHITPPLLDALKNPKDYDTISQLLGRYQASIPPLVNLLSDPLRGNGAYNILLTFGTAVIPHMIPALDHQSFAARKHSQNILTSLVQRENNPQPQQHLLAQILKLFGQLSPAQQQSYVWDNVLDIFTNQFPSISIPVLLQGLEEAKIRTGAAEALVRLVRKKAEYSSEALHQLLTALSVKEKSYGAAIALVQLREEAVGPVSELVTDDNEEVARVAQKILGEIGAPALHFVWSTYRDRDEKKRRASHNVFEHMSSEKIKDELVALLTSEERYDVEIALTLLLERMFVEDQKTTAEQKMIPALIEHIQQHSKDRSNLRVIALLLFQRKEIVLKHLHQMLYTDHQEWLAQVFLLLDIEGKEARDHLFGIFIDEKASFKLRGEVAGVMGMMGLEHELGQSATAMHQYSAFPATQHPTTLPLTHYAQLDICLRALGGLMASGKWNSEKLQDLLHRSPEDSPQHDLYSVLLGKQYSSQMRDLTKKLQVGETANRTQSNKISELENQNNKLKQDNKQLKRERDNLQRERDNLQATTNNLEQQLQQQPHWVHEE